MTKSARSRRKALIMAGVLAIAALAAVAAGCGSTSSPSTPAASGSAKPAGATLTPVAMTAGTMVGAGSSFIAPVLTKWGSGYSSSAGVQLNYQSIGSGGGISAIEAKTVDFGASDAPLAEADLQSNGLVQFPMIVGGVVPVVHLSGVADGQLKLTADVLASIYMGKTTKWNDPSITALNPGLKLPATKINVVHRSDASGTTWIFSHYLTAAAGTIWTAGADKTIPWPLGVGGKGNEGVAASVEQLSGAIGYVEYAYAKQANMTTAQMQNKAGQWVKPSITAFAAAAANADWKGSLPSMSLVIVNQPGKASWPITGATFVLVHKDQQDATRAQAMLTFFNWCYTSGAPTAASLDYVAIPAGVYKLIEKQVWNTVTVSGTPVWQQ